MPLPSIFQPATNTNLLGYSYGDSKNKFKDERGLTSRHRLKAMMTHQKVQLRNPNKMIAPRTCSNSLTAIFTWLFLPWKEHAEL